MNILIVSLKYSPVHNDHCRAMGEPLRRRGHSVRYLLTESARWTVPADQMQNTWFFGKSGNKYQILAELLRVLFYSWNQVDLLIRNFKPERIIFESTHPLNIYITNAAKKMKSKPQVWFLVHEPNVIDKRAHGILRWLSIHVAEKINAALYGKVDGIILASQEAERLLRLSNPWFRGCIIHMPLLFEDRFTLNCLKRRYFSFIGHAVKAKGIDIFFKIIEESDKEGARFDFLIATSSKISKYVSSLSSSARNRLYIINERHLSNRMIDEAIKASWAVIAPYRRVTQSGVVPVAFMHAKPVIAANKGAMPESVVPGITGFLVDNVDCISEWLTKMEMIQSSYLMLSSNCREYYLKNFDSSLAPIYLTRIIEDQEEKMP